MDGSSNIYSKYRSGLTSGVARIYTLIAGFSSLRNDPQAIDRKLKDIDDIIAEAHRVRKALLFFKNTHGVPPSGPATPPPFNKGA
jgi:hypothetical protein